jgi:SpoVK/Ycf46/Vps4 family AAA+-type ATPase
LKYFKKIMLVLAAAAALAFSLSVSLKLFVIIAVSVCAILLLVAVSRDMWRQTDRADRSPVRARPVRARPVRARPVRARARPPERAKPRPVTRSRGRRRSETLLPDATVTLSDERRAAGVDAVFATLDDQLVGLVPVKKRVEEIASLLLVDRVRRRFGLEAPRPNLHMCFTGAPGTGKTTVALQMADLLHRLGYGRH